MSTDLHSDFQYGTWLPSLQIGNGIIQGQYTDRVGHWTRIGHQIYVNGFFRLNYNEAQVEDAVRRNTTVQEIRIGTLPYEANSSASIFNLAVSRTPFIRNTQPKDTEILSVGARSIWGSPRMRVFINDRVIARNTNSANQIPLASDLSIQDLQPSTNGAFTEIRVSGTYTAFPDLATTDPVNTPPPTIIQPPPTSLPPPSENVWPPYPGLVLRRGMQGPSIRQVQEQLNALGVNPRLAEDGVFGPMTESAVMAFQRQRGLNIDGIVGAVTWDELFRM